MLKVPTYKVGLVGVWGEGSGSSEKEYAAYTQLYLEPKTPKHFYTSEQ